MLTKLTMMTSWSIPARYAGGLRSCGARGAVSLQATMLQRSTAGAGIKLRTGHTTGGTVTA